MDTDTVAADPELESISIVNADVVIVEWRDLIAAGQEQEVTDCDDNDCTHKKKKKMKMMQEALERAYGSTGAGILCIRGMPGFVAAKDAFLPMAHALATALAPSYLETHLTDAASLYNAGWSHGKEKLGADKPPDTAKGSFYYNPMTDLPGSAADREAYPLSYPCNVWPDENQILLPDFKKKAVAIGKLLKEACVAVAKQMDTLAATKQPSYTPNLLYNSMKDTDKVKARLLYYFPLVLDEEQQQQQQSTTNNYNPAFADSDTKKNEAVELAEDSWVRANY